MSEYDLNLNEENDVDNLSTDMFDCTQHSDIGNVNSKILQNILDKKRNDIKKVKVIYVEKVFNIFAQKHVIFFRLPKNGCCIPHK